MKYFGKTDTGRRRQINQDSFFASDKQVGDFPNLFLVADGVGHGSGGEYASSHTIEVILNYFERVRDTYTKGQLFHSAINIANLDLYNKSRSDSNYYDTGTTLVGGYVENDRLSIVNIGDSRCYKISDTIKQISYDHSYAEELVRAGQLERGTPDYDAKKNSIVRAVGAEPKIKIDYFDLTLKKDDYILFCSDGLTNMLTNQQIMDIVKEEGLDIEQKVNKLIEKANEAGGKDNITVILIQIDDIKDSLKELEDRVLWEIMIKRK